LGRRKSGVYHRKKESGGGEKNVNDSKKTAGGKEGGEVRKRISRKGEGRSRKEKGG